MRIITPPVVLWVNHLYLTCAFVLLHNLGQSRLVLNQDDEDVVLCQLADIGDGFAIDYDVVLLEPTHLLKILYRLYPLLLLNLKESEDINAS